MINLRFFCEQYDGVNRVSAEEIKERRRRQTVFFFFNYVLNNHKVSNYKKQRQKQEREREKERLRSGICEGGG